VPAIRRWLPSPPLALYVHIPWCIRKCSYCDFNSHAAPAHIPEWLYIDTLLRDLEQDIAEVEPQRPLVSIFIGGGTPSLFSGKGIARLLEGVRGLIDLEPQIETTLEANPGTADARNFTGYREAGVNRLSIGAQSLSPAHLARLGRIHGPDEILAAVKHARSAGFSNLNLDLMYGLPGQTLDQARQDLERALRLAPEHVSYYQLTLEPNTAFHVSPPPLPGDDLVTDMELQGSEMLANAGYAQYEVSAYALAEQRCLHNLNYWTFGDYLGIGAGAHGKLTHGIRRFERYAKCRHPAAYLDPANRTSLVSSRRVLHEPDLVLEFAMNALRLTEGFESGLFERRTGLPLERISGILEAACEDGLLTAFAGHIQPTELGRRFLNDLIARFDPS
jgi:putative oxygen-independent coproporphyrinogen III oxidase